MRGLNPYKASSGPEIDLAVHEHFFTGNGPVLPYSSDEASAEKVRMRLKALYKYSVEVGETQTRPKRFFARLESGPSTSTEVLAETRPLAICRLALLMGIRRGAV